MRVIDDAVRYKVVVMLKGVKCLVIDTPFCCFRVLVVLTHNLVLGGPYMCEHNACVCEIDDDASYPLNDAEMGLYGYVRLY